MEEIVTYLQTSKTIVSKTSTGPVLPKIVSGCPLKRPYIMPHSAPHTKLSMVACDNIMSDSVIHWLTSCGYFTHNIISRCITQQTTECDDR